MGTNYYTKILVQCPNCNEFIEGEQEIHIGKSSGGWTFIFELGNKVNSKCRVNNTKDYLKFLKLYCGRLYDEYNREIDLEDLRELIYSKKDELYNELCCEGDFFDGIARFTNRKFS